MDNTLNTSPEETQQPPVETPSTTEGSPPPVEKIEETPPVEEKPEETPPVEEKPEKDEFLLKEKLSPKKDEEKKLFTLEKKEDYQFPLDADSLTTQCKDAPEYKDYTVRELEQMQEALDIVLKTAEKDLRQQSPEGNSFIPFVSKIQYLAEKNIFPMTIEENAIAFDFSYLLENYKKIKNDYQVQLMLEQGKEQEKNVRQTQEYLTQVKMQGGFN